jgi:hypothetical protein
VKTINLAVLPFTILAAAMLGGCVGAESGDEPETATEGEPGDGTEMVTETATEDEPGDGTETATEDEPTAEHTAALLQNEVMYTDDPAPGGVVYFTAYGDKVKLCDIEADGRGVTLNVSHNGVTRYNMSVGGWGNCVTRSNSSGPAFDLPEGKVYKFRICLTSGWCDEAWWANQN